MSPRPYYFFAGYCVHPHGAIDTLHINPILAAVVVVLENTYGLFNALRSVFDIPPARSCSICTFLPLRSGRTGGSH